MPNTTNFNWVTPADSDLVKDGAAAIRTLGNGIDTSFVDLKGGTSGQILSKNSNTDLDFVWIANDQGDITAVTAGTGISGGGTSGAVTITNSMATEIDAKGDLVAGTGADTFARLAVGANDTVLTADSSTSTGLKWATPSSGGFTLLSTTTLAAQSTTISSISGSYKHLVLYSKTITDTAAGGGFLNLRFNSDTGSNYSKTSIRNLNNTVAGLRELSQTSVVINSRLQTTSTVTKLGSNAVWIYRYTDTDHIDLYFTSYGHTITGTETCYETGYGQYDAAAAITSITIIGDTSLAGTVYLYGVS